MLRDIFEAQLRILSLRQSIDTLPEDWKRYFGYVLIVTWVVGMGRYWDSPDARLLQYLGLGSVIYLFAMSTLLWMVLFPIARRPISYVQVIIFVGMTALPALLYAIPVESFLPMDIAAKTNVIFLAIVAIWRVILLSNFASKAAGLRFWGVLTVTMLPLSGIMIILAMFSLEHVTFDVMSGIRADDAYPRTMAGEIASGVTEAAGWTHATVGILSFFSWILFPIFAVSWLVQLSYATDERRNRQRQKIELQ
ncbi:hypothetical protein [Magnetospira sp. QH-2]|uniref:hypothetical protein n=1 Tax=Magnetospira sp. (strain QH-2) TaxID=1288970 RepID=UPI0005F9D0EA|nr:hypothetical protein [Magnetospira sp. QH-2]